MSLLANCIEMVQDPKNGVENLCVVGGDSRSWLCNPQDRSGVLRAELQLERASYFGYIDVGKAHQD